MFFLVACQTGPSISEVHYGADDNLNPNSQNESTPLNVRIYQLKDRTKFDGANFDHLWDKDKEVLGDTIIGSAQEAVVTKGEVGSIEVTLDKDTKFIGLMGLFNEEEQDAWRKCVSVDELDDYLFYFKKFKIEKRDQ